MTNGSQVRIFACHNSEYLFVSADLLGIIKVVDQSTQGSREDAMAGAYQSRRVQRDGGRSYTVSTAEDRADALKARVSSFESQPVKPWRELCGSNHVIRIPVSSLPEEVKAARDWPRRLESYREVVVVPGQLLQEIEVASIWDGSVRLHISRGGVPVLNTSVGPFVRGKLLKALQELGLPVRA